MSRKLRDYSITHAGIRKVYDKKLDTERDGQAATRYLRFIGKARLERLELPVHVHGRMIPSVPVHPADPEPTPIDPAPRPRRGR